MTGNRSLKYSAVLAILVLFSAVFFAGCGGDSEDSAGVTPVAGSNDVPDAVGGSTDGTITNEPPPVQVLSGLETGKRVSKPTVIVVRSRSQYQSLLKQHFSNGVKKADLPGTDFKSRQVVALFVPKQKAGTQLFIDGINEDRKNKKVIVKAVLMPPGEGCDTKGQPRYPFHFVETRTMVGDPVLKLERQRQSGC